MTLQSEKDPKRTPAKTHAQKQMGRNKPHVISDEKVLWLAIECFGDIAQRIKAIEEMGELSAALSREVQSMAASAEHREHVPKIEESAIIEEIADVTIMVCQLARIYGQEKVVKAQRVKMDRLKELVRKELAQMATGTEHEEHEDEA